MLFLTLLMFVTTFDKQAIHHRPHQASQPHQVLPLEAPQAAQEVRDPLSVLTALSLNEQDSALAHCKHVSAHWQRLTAMTTPRQMMAAWVSLAMTLTAAPVTCYPK